MSARVNTADVVLQTIRDRIRSGEFTVGMHLSIYQLAAELGVSRTPVREAVVRLAQTGMLQITKNRGVTVRRIGPEDLAAIFEARILLEVPVAARAAARVTAEEMRGIDDSLRRMDRAIADGDVTGFFESDRSLHDQLLALGGNRRVQELVGGLRDMTQAMGALTITASRTLEDVRDEHLPIVEAVRAKDSPRASEAMRVHLVETGKLLMRQVDDGNHETFVESWPGDFIDFL